MPDPTANDAAPPVQERLAAIDNAVLINVLTKAKEGKSVTATDWREARRIAHELGLGGTPASPTVRGFPRATAIDLAEALGVHRNSVGRWRKEYQECPPGPPYDEYSWRCWAAAKGIDIPRAPDPALLELLANTGIPQYRRQGTPEPSPGIAIQGEATKPESPPSIAVTFDEKKKQADARAAQALAEGREFELACKRRQYIAVEDVHRLVDAIAGLVADACDQIAAPAAAAVHLPPDQAELLRVAILDQIHAGRRRVAASAESLLAKALESPT